MAPRAISLTRMEQSPTPPGGGPEMNPIAAELLAAMRHHARAMPYAPLPDQPPSGAYKLHRRWAKEAYPRYRLPLPPHIGRLFPARGNSRCGRCARPWWAVRREHSTPVLRAKVYAMAGGGVLRAPGQAPIELSAPEVKNAVVWGGEGVFPLCHRCWRSLGTPARRIRYYRAMYDAWRAQDPGAYDETKDWLPIARAVLEDL